MCIIFAGNIIGKHEIESDLKSINAKYEFPNMFGDYIILKCCILDIRAIFSKIISNWNLN